MSDATCKTCPWWEPDRGQCRANPPTVIQVRETEGDRYMRVIEYRGKGYWPKTLAESWCGQHPDRLPVFLAEVKEAPAALTESDVKRIVRGVLHTEAQAAAAVRRGSST